MGQANLQIEELLASTKSMSLSLRVNDGDGVKSDDTKEKEKEKVESPTRKNSIAIPRKTSIALASYHGYLAQLDAVTKKLQMVDSQAVAYYRKWQVAQWEIRKLEAKLKTVEPGKI